MYAGNSVGLFLLVDGLDIVAVRARILLRRVIIRVPVLGLPVGADEATGLFKISRLVQVLLAALNLGFHAAASLGPLAHVSCHFLVGALISQLLVLVVPPELLQLLLLELVSREIRKVRGRTLELVHRRELHLLL